MPWCPKCGAEYRPESDTCADCEEPLVSDEPESSARRANPRRLAVVLNLVYSLALVAVTFGAACSTMLFFPRQSEPIQAAAMIGILCFGGILFALLQPKPRLGQSFILWAILPALFLVGRAIQLRNLLRYMLDLEMVGYFALYVLIGSGIGAITATIAGLWFSGQGHKYALALLVTVAAFVSTPLAVYWLARRLYG